MNDGHGDGFGARIPRTRIETFLAIATLAILFYATALTLRPFFPALLWGVVLAIASAPLHARIARAMPGWPRLAAIVISLALTLIIVVPAVALTQAIVTYAPAVSAWIDSVSTNGLPPVPASVTDLPVVGAVVGENWPALSDRLSAYITHFKDDLEAWLLWAFQQLETAGAFVLEFAFAVVLAGVFLANRARLTAIAELFFGRIGGAFGAQLLAKSVVTTRSTVRGVVGAAAAQAVVAAPVYYLSGVPAWIFITGLTFLVALTQIGSFLVWVPVALWLVLQDEPGWAVFLLLWGTFALHGVDNVVRPLLVSQGTHLPFLLVFVGVLGGLIAWGLIGVFLGPIILAIAYELILEWFRAERRAADDGASEPSAAVDR